MSQKLKVFKTKNLGQLRLFFISRARQAFIKLRQVFIKVLIPNYFDLKHHIHITIDFSHYVINESLS